MNNYIAIIMPSLKIGGGNRVLLQFLNKAIENDNKCKLFYLDRRGDNFKDLPPNTVSQNVYGDGVISILFFSIILSLKLRFDKSIKYVLVSDPILSIFSFIYSNKKKIRFVQSNDLLLFEENIKGNTILNRIYKKFYTFSQHYQYHKIIFNSKYSLDSYNNLLRPRNMYSDDCIINPPVFTLNYESNINNISAYKKTTIAIVTNNHPRKGYKAFIDIVKKSKLKELNFIVISQDELNSGLSNVLHLKPNSDDEYVQALKNCHFILSTSTFEGFGLPLIESMALGVVPIAIYNKGMDEYNGNQSITIIKSPEDFDVQITNIITNNDKYIKLSKEAIKTASVFTEQKFYSSIIEKIY